MASIRRSTSLTTSADISTRKLPDLPPEAYSESKISRLWNSVKNRLGSKRGIRRSQTVSSDLTISML